MLKSEKLKKTKKNIIEQLITTEKLEKVKKESMLKGGYLKNFFNYLLFKPFKFEKLKTNEDVFFVKESGENIIKNTFFSSLVISLTICLFFYVFGKESYTLITLIGMLTFDALVMFMTYVMYKSKNRKTMKRFNVNKIKEIKENLSKNYNEKTQEMLLDGKLNKKELIKILKDLNEIIKKEDILFCFNELRKRNQDNEKLNDISEPYTLIKIINELIINEEKKEEFQEKINKEKNIGKFNERVFVSLIDDNSNNDNESVSNEKSIKSLLLGFNSVKNEIKFGVSDFK